MKLLWSAAGDHAPIHIMGGGPPTPRPALDPVIAALVREADVFWNEVPEITPDDVALVARFGIDPAAPLDGWLDERDCERVVAAAIAVGANPESLRPLRPWLASQVLKQSAQSAAGLVAGNAIEFVLAEVARGADVPVYSEWPTPADLFASFGGLDPESDVALLLIAIEDIEAGVDQIVRDAESVAAGEPSVGERFAEHAREVYPAFYESLLVARNRRWVERILDMRRRGESAFIYVGSAHVAGPDSIQAMLAAEGVMTELVQ